MKTIASLLFGLLVSSLIYPQVTSQPALPTASNQVVITFRATQGSGNLAGFTGDVYTHTGVMVEGNPNWQYVVGSWGNNTTQPRLTRVGTDTYQLTISPSIREFYGVPLDKKIVRLCFVFRAGSGSPQTEDLFIDVVEQGLNVSILTPTWDSPLHDYGASLRVEAQANESESLRLFINNIEVATSSTNTVSYSHSINEYGKQWVKAIATAGQNAVADSVYFFVRDTVPVAALPSGVIPGINITGSNQVTLVLHDPPALKEFAFAIGSFSNWELHDDFYMNRTPDGKHYWLTLTDLDPTKEYIYQYWIDGQLRLADPYTEKVSDPWNDKWISSSNYPNLISYPEGKTSGIASVFQIEQPAYQWTTMGYTPPAKKDLIIYELHIRDFVEDDYIGSVMAKLDYLEKLGVNAIGLMPINEFEGNDSWGYNPSFYFAPDKAYGTKNDYKRFIDECHKRGIAVIIDMVFNHSFGQSPLVQMYFDPNAGQWGSPTASNPWYNQTCPHEPWCWGYDFNHSSQYTKDFIDRVVTHWLTEYQADGFRLDFTKGFTNSQTANQGSNYDASRVASLKRLADHIWSVNPDAYVILEHFCENREEKELAEYRSSEGKGMMVWGNMNHSYNEATMGWLANSNFSWVSHVQRGWAVPHLIGYMESHDEERLMFKNLAFGNSTNPNHDVKQLDVALQRQRLAGAFLFTIPGPKMIWQFGELGYDYSINHCPNGTISDQCRTSRKPIRWDYMTDWNRRDLYNTWAELISLRRSLPVFSTDDFSLSLAGAAKTITLRHPSMNALIVGNFGLTNQDVTINFPSVGTWFEYYSGTELSLASTSSTLSINPGHFRIFTTTKLNREDYFVGVVDKQADPQFLAINVWPNPLSTELTISISSQQGGRVDVALFDLNGRKVAAVYRGNLQPGGNSLQWGRADSLQKGVYMLVVQTTAERRVVKLSVI